MRNIIKRRKELDDFHRQAKEDHPGSGSRGNAGSSNSAAEKGTSTRAPESKSASLIKSTSLMENYWAQVAKLEKPLEEKRLPVVYQEEPIRAWKAVKLRSDESSIWLRSMYQSEHVPLQGRASCYCVDSPFQTITIPRGPAAHIDKDIPVLECSCGWYGFSTREMVQSYGADMCVAEVDFFGKIIEAEEGYRAEYQRILALYIPRGAHCQYGFLCDKRPDLLDFPLRNKAENTPVKPPVPVCVEHATPRTVTLDKVASRLGVKVHWSGTVG